MKTRARRFLRMVTALAGVAGATGCRVGPEYHAPHPAVPAKFENGGDPRSNAATTQTASSPSSLIDTGHAVWVEWWTNFHDDELNSLIDRALAANHELRIATVRVQQARAVERMARSELFPTVDVGGGFGKTRGSAAGFGFPYGIPGADSSLFQIGFDATYEVDLFGGVQRTIETAAASADAVEAERRATQVSLLAEVARGYILLRALQTRLAIAGQNRADQRTTARIVERRLQNGLSPNFDLVRARAEVEATESSIPPIESGIRQTIYALSVLLGENPPDLLTELSAPKPVPPVPPAVPIGLPSELLRRRPDVIRAERIIAVATAAQGVATSDLFPHVLLGGTPGVQSRRATNLFNQHDPSSGFYAAGPAASWTIFDGGRRLAGLDRAKAEVAEAVSAYELTVLRALQDVDSATTAYSHDQARRDSLAALVAENEQAVRIARAEYANGLIQLLDVLDVQRNLYRSQDALAQATQTVSTDLVALYKALGGGWETVKS